MKTKYIIMKASMVDESGQAVDPRKYNWKPNSGVAYDDYNEAAVVRLQCMAGLSSDTLLKVCKIVSC